MKTTIRQNTFETNSSSVHAIVIDTRSGYEENPSREIWKGSVDAEYFGRGYAQIRVDISSRLNYLWTGVVQYCLENKDSDNPVHNLEVWKKKIMRIVDMPDLDFQEINEEDLYREYGVDHCESLYELLDQFFENEQLLRDYILGKDSYLIIGSDELWIDEVCNKTNIGQYYKKYREDEDKIWDIAHEQSHGNNSKLFEIYERLLAEKNPVSEFENGEVKLYIKAN